MKSGSHPGCTSPSLPPASRARRYTSPDCDNATDLRRSNCLKRRSPLTPIETHQPLGHISGRKHYSDPGTQHNYTSTSGTQFPVWTGNLTTSPVEIPTHLATNGYNPVEFDIKPLCVGFPAEFCRHSLIVGNLPGEVLRYQVLYGR